MKKEYGLYIHIPFCKSKCYYCDFYSENYKEEYTEQYIDSLEKEILYLHKKYNILDTDIITIYIGGGTPSVFTSCQISKILNLINSHFNLTSLKEFNIEVNPESINEEKLSIIKNFISNLKKVNLRISIGVQSFNNTILNNLGRLHSSEDVYKLVNILDKLQIKNYNFDLIFGCPEQTIDDIKYDLKNIIQLNPVHVSYYALTVEENTKFYEIGYSPDDELQYNMYNLITTTLNLNKFKQYEISNFCKNGYECLHNLNYWLYKEYIGLGPSAVSFISNFRIKNVSSVNEYINGEFKYFFEEIDENKALKEQIMLKLRTDFGIGIEESIFKKYSNIFEKLIKEGKLIIENKSVKIHSNYKFLSNSIIMEFF